jgi:hypothetical protein
MKIRRLAGVSAGLLLALGTALVTVAPVAAASGGAAGSTYHPITPTRIVDTRYGIGMSGALSVHQARTFTVASSGGGVLIGGGAVVPAGATAVTGNLTVTAQTSNGYLYIGPDPVDYPTSSTLNFPVGDNRANAVTVALSATGSLSVTFVAPTFGQTAQVVFDVSGYFASDPADSTYVPLTPARILDTRYSIGLGGVFTSSSARSFPVVGRGGVPAGATAVTGNLTVTAQTGAGYLYVGPTPTNAPTSSTLNFPAGDNRANAVAVPLGPDGSLSITYISASSSYSTAAIFDVTGYFIGGGGGALYYPIAPERAADSRSDSGLNGPIPNVVPVSLAISGGNSPVPAEAQAVTGNVTITQQHGAGWVAVTPYTFVPGTSTLNFPVGDDRANEFISALGGSSLGLTYASSIAGTAQIVVDITGYFAGGSFAAPAAPAFTGMNLYRATAWSHQATQSWCTGASTQMMLNLVTGVSDHSSTNQGTYVSYAYHHSLYLAKGGVGAEIDGWANAATAYGAGTYAVAAYTTQDAALKAAATRMRISGKPVGLVVMEGHHAWVMAGFTSTGDDPALGQNFTLTSVVVMAPDYGTISYDPAPGAAESIAYMKTKLTGYTDDFPTIWDGKFAIIAP